MNRRCLNCLDLGIYWARHKWSKLLLVKFVFRGCTVQYLCTMEAGYGHFVCSFWRLMEGDKTNKRQNEISFLRFGDLYNATKRTNDKTKWPQNLILSRCRSVVLAPHGSRQNEQKRRNEISIFRFGLCLFWRLDQRDVTKLRNEEMKFHFFVLATCTTRQNEQSKK